MSDNKRKITKITKGMPTSDGAGVKLVRVFPTHEVELLDPFLLLDEFGTDDPDDYIAGFPMHPHRGFETVTYMLDGTMKHEDSSGNEGILGPGAVQWMTAGRGIMHSEMPQQKEGRMRGFQLWVNLPAKDKMTTPRYQNIEADGVPEVTRENGVAIRIIAGKIDNVTGPVNNVAADPVYLDVTIPAGETFSHTVAGDHTLFVYIFEGDLEGEGATKVLAPALLLFGDGDMVELKGGDDGARMILVAGIPFNEPVARYGPFVMNTKEEISQAIEDHRRGKLAV